MPQAADSAIPVDRSFVFQWEDGWLFVFLDASLVARLRDVWVSYTLNPKPFGCWGFRLFFCPAAVRRGGPIGRTIRKRSGASAGSTMFGQIVQGTYSPIA